MNLQQYATLFNLCAISLVLIVSWGVLHKFPSRFFSRWTTSYACTLLLLTLDFVRGYGRYVRLLDWAMILASQLALVFLIRTALLLRERPEPPRALWIWVVGVAALGAGLLLIHVPPIWVMAMPALCYSLSGATLGVVLILNSRTEKRPTHWVGWPLLVLATWSLSFAAIQGTSYVWFGYALSGLLQILVGLGMLVFLLEQTADQLADQNMQLKRLNEIKTNFLSVVSHELRTPLASMLGYMELIEDGLAGPVTSEQGEYLKHMKRSGRQLRSLVDSLLDTVQMEAGELTVHCEPMELDAAIRQSADTLRSLLDKKSLALSLELPDDPTWVMGDAERIGQVLVNLIGNAIKFTNDAGKIRIELVRDGERACVRIADTGIGIPSDKLPHIFEPFFQVDGTLTRRHGGTGLGLAITKQLVEAMQGEITVQSREGQGTTCEFCLPLTRDPIALPSSPR